MAAISIHDCVLPTLQPLVKAKSGCSSSSNPNYPGGQLSQRNLDWAFTMKEEPTTALFESIASSPQQHIFGISHLAFFQRNRQPPACNRQCHSHTPIPVCLLSEGFHLLVNFDKPRARK